LAAVAIAVEQRPVRCVRSGVQGVQCWQPHAREVLRGGFRLAAVLRGHRRGCQEGGVFRGQIELIDESVVAIGTGAVAGEGGGLCGL